MTEKKDREKKVMKCCGTGVVKGEIKREDTHHSKRDTHHNKRGDSPQRDRTRQTDRER